MAIIVINRTTRLTTSTELTKEQNELIKSLVDEDKSIDFIADCLEAKITSNQKNIAVFNIEPFDVEEMLQSLETLFGSQD